MTPPESVEKVAECHFFEFFSSGACAYGAASTECRESLAAQALFADLTHTPQGALSCPCRAIHLVSPNPNKAIRGCGPLSTPGFFDSLYFVGRHMVHTGQKNVTMLRSAVLTKYFMLKF